MLPSIQQMLGAPFKPGFGLNAPHCHPKETPCLWQVTGGMTLKNRHGCDARRAGRQTVQPEGLGLNSE